MSPIEPKELVCQAHALKDVLSYADDSVTVAKLQVGLLGDARRLQKQLDRIAGRADTNTPSGLHYILQGEHSYRRLFSFVTCSGLVTMPHSKCASHVIIAGTRLSTVMQDMMLTGRAVSSGDIACR